MTATFLMRSMFVSVTAACLFGASGTSLAQTQNPHPRQETHSASKPKTGLSSYQLLYYMMLGEIAFSRQDVSTALASYGELVKRTDDPRILSRANEIGLTSALLDVQNKPAEAEAAIRSVLASRENLRVRLLAQLPLIFGHVEDKAEVARIVDRLTAPYLDLAESHLARASADLDAGIKDKAHTESAAALNLNPDLEQAILLLAQTAPEAERSQMMEKLGAFAQAHPQALDSRINYIRWLVMEKRNEEARDQYQQLLKDFPDNDPLAFAIIGIAAQIEDMKTTEALLTRLVAHEWGDVDRMRVLLGEVQAETGKQDEAMRTLEAVRPGPQFMAATIQKARIFAARKQLPLAIQSLHEAAQASPDDKSALQGVEAILLRQSGQNDAAYKILQEILVREPDNQEALYDAAMLDEQAGRTELMEKRLNHLIELKPDNAMALNALGYSFVDRNIRLDEAETLLTKANKLDPEDPAILDSVGWMHFRRGNNAEALDFLQRAYARFPDPEVAGHLIEVLTTDGKRDEARKLLKDAIKANPDSRQLKALAKRLSL
jgi:tetratricopeptide (TPR) repeat protein